MSYRLALHAANVVYGKKGLPKRGPVPVKISFLQGGKAATILFDKKIK